MNNNMAFRLKLALYSRPSSQAHHWTVFFLEAHARILGRYAFLRTPAFPLDAKRIQTRDIAKHANRPTTALPRETIAAAHQDTGVSGVSDTVINMKIPRATTPTNIKFAHSQGNMERLNRT